MLERCTFVAVVCLLSDTPVYVFVDAYGLLVCHLPAIRGMVMLRCNAVPRPCTMLHAAATRLTRVTGFGLFAHGHGTAVRYMLCFFRLGFVARSWDTAQVGKGLIIAIFAF